MFVIEGYSIPSKYRNVTGRLILLIISSIYNQTRPIWFDYDNQIARSMVCDWLINNQGMIDWLMDWFNNESNPILNSIRSDSIHSSFNALIIQSLSIFSMQWSFLIRWGKINILFSINDCIVLSFYWTMDSQMWIITTNINPFDPYRCVTIKSNLLDYSK